MEAATARNDGDNGRWWSHTTNWDIAGGCLDASVIVESSDAPVNFDAVDSGRRPPLILKPPSLGSDPCEITVNFPQKYEARQIYIRSTARVYEIYYAPHTQTGNEYLCTVRCGVAARDEESPPSPTNEVAAGALQNRGGLVRDKEKSNIASIDDGWVEVKVSDSPSEDKEKNALPKGNDVRVTDIKDLYEATAEITDSDACISLTFRLLSLQSKGCICIEEIYVFADPVESDHSENQVVQEGNSAGNSLMAMFVPTLLQLSKTSISRVQDKHNSDKMGKGNSDMESRMTHAENIENEVRHEVKVSDQQNVKLPELNASVPQLPQLGSLTQVLDGEQRHDFATKGGLSCGNIETILEQLVSRVSRIEDICLRFEEAILKPISGMETRLQMVEHQLEILAKNTEHSQFLSCTRISAPEFSCDGSNSSSFYNEGSEHTTYGTLQSGKKAFSNPPSDVPVSVNATHLLPSLVVTVPEFSCGDGEEDKDALELAKDSQVDEKENDALEIAKVSPQEKKQPLSIDDALAAALSRFFSASSVDPSLHPQTRSIKAPEFTFEEKDDDDNVVLLGVISDKPLDPSIFSFEFDGVAHAGDLALTSTTVSSLGYVERPINDLKSEFFLKTSEHDKLHEACPASIPQHICFNRQPNLANHAVMKTSDCQITKLTNDSQESNEASSVSVSAKARIEKQFPVDKTDHGSDAPQEGAAARSTCIPEGSEEGILQRVHKSPCELDFDIPILDVKFVPKEYSGKKSFLEELLTDVPECLAEAPYDLPKDVDDIMSVDDGKQKGLLADYSLLADCASNHTSYMSSNVECETQDPYTDHRQQEEFVSLI